MRAFEGDRFLFPRGARRLSAHNPSPESVPPDRGTRAQAPERRLLAMRGSPARRECTSRVSPPLAARVESRWDQVQSAATRAHRVTWWKPGLLGVPPVMEAAGGSCFLARG